MLGKEQRYGAPKRGPTALGPASQRNCRSRKTRSTIGGRQVGLLMEVHSQDPKSAKADSLVRFGEELLLARATELAQSGRLLEAEALLTNGRNPESPKEMDLLARIAA